MNARASQRRARAKNAIAYATCPFCGEHIDLYARKDFESFSKIEVYEHYQHDHPEVLTHEFGMPYTPIHFYEEV